MGSDYCRCGNPKYPDADCCEECWRDSKVRSGEIDEADCPHCGRPKEARDAPMCSRCWNERRPYGDR